MIYVKPFTCTFFMIYQKPNTRHFFYHFAYKKGKKVVHKKVEKRIKKNEVRSESIKEDDHPITHILSEDKKDAKKIRSDREEVRKRNKRCEPSRVISCRTKCRWG